MNTQSIARTAAFALLLAASIQAGVTPPAAVRLEQISFPTQPFSVVGAITIDRAAAGQPGFVNVVDPLTNEWLVRNLPLFGAGEGFASPTISTRWNATAFVPGQVAGAPIPGPIQLVIDLDPDPSTTVSEVIAHGTPPSSWSVFPLDVQYGGEPGIDGDMTPTDPPDFTGLWFNPLALALSDYHFQTGYENVQAAHNQCAPAAIANCLQFLENTAGLTIPQAHNKGLRTLGAAVDGTLVGAIDDATQRAVVANRRDTRSSGVWPLEGALQYIANQNLGPFMTVEHRIGLVAGNSGAVLDPNANFAFAGQTSYGDITDHGTELHVASMATTILRGGYAIAFDYRWGVGAGTRRHYVTLVGGGLIKGRPFLLHVSDYAQASKDAPDTAGCDRVDFDWIDEDTLKLSNVNARIDQMIHFRAHSPGWEFCYGSGFGTQCPCANNSALTDHAGCLNSLGVGATLRTSGVSSLAADSLKLTGANMPNSSALYFQGSAQVAGGNGAVFGDGLRCAGGAITRLGLKTNAGGTSVFPSGANPAVSVKGLVVMPGTTRYYQCWYRNAAVFCVPITFNLTNGVAIHWSP